MREAWSKQFVFTFLYWCTVGFRHDVVWHCNTRVLSVCLIGTYQALIGLPLKNVRFAFVAEFCCWQHTDILKYWNVFTACFCFALFYFVFVWFRWASRWALWKDLIRSNSNRIFALDLKWFVKFSNEIQEHKFSNGCFGQLKRNCNGF